MIERKPPRAARQSALALAGGAELYQLFRAHVALEAPVSAVAVSAIASATGLKERRIRELAKRFKENPVAASLASLPKGPKPGSHRFAAGSLSAIDDLIREVYLKMAPPSKAEAARQIRGILIADNGDYRLASDDVPSERSIERLIDEISEPQRARASMGSKQRTAHEPHPGHYASRGLLDLVQMDHTRADVILVDSTQRIELGRPWVTLLIDVWTRVVLGFYVSFGDPSIFRCGRAIANAVLPKEGLLDALGIDVAYPMHGLFKRLHADHAAPHRAESFRFACLSYGIDPDVRPHGPAHFGGHIERLIGTMMGKMRLLPGATGSNATKRDGYDAGTAATMTIAEFERWLIRAICQYHNTPHAALDKRAPAQFWRQEVERHGPLLPPGLDCNSLTRRFLPWVERTVRPDGVRVDHRTYWHPRMALHIGQKIMVHFDERTIRTAFPELEGEIVEAPVTGDYPDVGAAEWKAAREQLRQTGRAFQEGSAKAETARLIHANRLEVAAAITKTKEARQLRKRREREGVSHMRTPQGDSAPAPTAWISVAELGEPKWLKIP